MSNILRYIPNSTVVEKDGRLFYGRQRSFVIVEDAGKISVAEPSGLCPIPKYVLDGIPYGNEIGVLGKVDRNDLDIDKQLKDKIILIINEFFSDYTELDNVYDLPQNSLRQQNNRFGIRIGSKTDINNVGCTTVNRNFQIVLVNGFLNRANSEDRQIQVAEKLRKDGELLRRLIKKTKAGVFINARVVRDYSEDQVNFNQNDNFASLILNFTLEYRTKV